MYKTLLLLFFPSPKLQFFFTHILPVPTFTFLIEHHLFIYPLCLSSEYGFIDPFSYVNRIFLTFSMKGSFLICYRFSRDNKNILGIMLCNIIKLVIKLSAITYYSTYIATIIITVVSMHMNASLVL